MSNPNFCAIDHACRFDPYFYREDEVEEEETPSDNYGRPLSQHQRFQKACKDPDSPYFLYD